ncbi:MAG: VCBS repeat-containing protein [Balneolaceae bacterium]|nr:VCBS repeat-containing protein [Balneolaceae bacterium]
MRLVDVQIPAAVHRPSWDGKHQTEGNSFLGQSVFERSPQESSTPSAHYLQFNTSGSLSASHQLSAHESSTGPVSAADYDGDGDLDLFIGGRVVPGQFPRDAGSYLFRNEGGEFIQDQSNSDLFNNIGMVTGAVFSDYDGDGDPDLVLSCEWGAIRIFENRKGTFSDQTEVLGLASFKGQWKSVTTGDFNNDGRIDIVATNVGENSPYQIGGDHPIKMYYSDLNMDGLVEMVEARYDSLMGGYVPIQKLYDFSIFSSVLTSRVQSFEQYSSRTLTELLGTTQDQMQVKEINTVQHKLFINTGGNFEPHPLPPEAQFTTTMGGSVADYNNDGNEDLFLSQNYFDFYETFPRQDAGRGLWLRGDGQGNFKAVPGTESGVKIYGEQRGTAVADFDADGRIDLIVTQRDSTTKLYRNRIKKRGLRIRLLGPSKNIQGIGSSVRVVYSDGSRGPVREIKAGSGHRSMNSLTVVMGTLEGKEPEALEVTLV